jgi:hypothetical protein
LRFALSLTFVALAAWTGSVQANCGASTCAINTDWEMQGTSADPGTRFDLRYEFIDQDKLQHGTERIGMDQAEGQHKEVRTLNRNWVATLDHGIDAHWGVTVTLPMVGRSHTHIFDDGTTQEVEKWDFTELGDVQVVGRYTLDQPARESASSGLLFGVKLPTGLHSIQNDAGEAAERGLQPGTGTTDAILGAFHRGSIGDDDWFIQGRWQHALEERAGFQPGDRMTIDLGYRHSLSRKLALLAQVNTVHRGRDGGNEAEPAESGGDALYFAPGVSYEIAHGSRVYGLLQLPLWQRVNGMQLTANWGLTVGITTRF